MGKELNLLEEFLQTNEIFSINDKNLKHLSRLSKIGELIDLVDGKSIEGVDNQKIDNSDILTISKIILEQIENVLGKNPEEIKNSSIEKVALKIGDELINRRNVLDFAVGNYVNRIAYQISNIHLRHERYKKHLENRKLKLENKTDSLTQLLTKTSINSYIALAINGKINKDKDNANYGVILVDIDNFKIINDNFGHVAGDIVLEEISKIFLKSFRETDKVGRWGGEEFIVLMKGGNSKIYGNKIEEVRLYLEENLLNIVNRRIEKEGKIDKITLNNITVSAGITDLSENDCVTSVTKRADEALYSSKRSGKNKVTVLYRFGTTL